MIMTSALLMYALGSRDQYNSSVATQADIHRTSHSVVHICITHVDKSHLRNTVGRVYQ